ncbi:MAG: NADPH-dependent glutamate synthase [Clostridia bacterium]|nr:NADPH-dependent glutamate synthase [Clostridia bacterium]
MPNMSLKKNPMPAQEPEVRARNFKEVALGYTAEQAIDEANRCLNCKNPVCVKGCPVNVPIPQFIKKVQEGDFEGAYQVISLTSSLPAVCGRVCPQETQCEAKCIRGIKGEPVAIGRLERFVADYHNEHATEAPVKPESNGHKVAVVGSGPAGLTCAGDLAKKGYDVTVFEAFHLAGGVLVYGIPEFRLPKAIVQKEVDTLKALGVKIETNMVIGKTLTIDELMEEYGFEAVFVGSGAGLPRFMRIPGESLRGVYSANEFLTRNNLMKAYKDDATTPILRARKVAVVGGGNVAMDAARTALRLGADEVSIVYRRSLEELPARAEEVEHAMEEGIQFRLLNNPVEILGYNNPEDKRDPKNGSVIGMKCIKMELGEPDASGRRSPVEVPGSEFVMDVDCVIMSIGTSPNPLIKDTTAGLEVNRWGGIIVTEETGATTKPGVYAGGDAVTGAATVILAMGAGKTAAAAIDKQIMGELRVRDSVSSSAKNPFEKGFLELPKLL